MAEPKSAALPLGYAPPAALPVNGFWRRIKVVTSLLLGMGIYLCNTGAAMQVDGIYLAISGFGLRETATPCKEIRGTSAISTCPSPSPTPSSAHN